MDVAIIGAGSVGTALATGLASAGHTVRVGVRDPDGRDPIGPVTPTTPAEAVAGADAVVLAVPAAALPTLLEDLAEALGGVAVLDATNRLRRSPDGLLVDPDGWGARRIAERLPSARVVKAFNTIGADHMDGSAAGATMLLAGDDEDAKRAAAELARDLGFEPVDVGPLAQAEHLEHLAALWVQLAASGQGRGIAFLVRGASPMR
jgi:8-hydroxy-5-deazaflavin:NADPH oxidoreductase